MKRLTRCLLLVAIALLIGLAVSGCAKEAAKVATKPLADPIKTDTGYISGTIIGDVGKEVRIYRGIPYAAPPVGDLRWKPPQPAAPWQGIRESTAFGKACPQSGLALSDQSEDCLYLNVLTPAKKASDNLPVMVWLHGEGYNGGSGMMYETTLPQKGVVIVSLNMRLGPLGFLAHPLLSKESPKGASGNYMFLDIIATLEWVQRNIAAFGGNPKNVTVFGESSGGNKVAALIASPLAKGLFHRGIMQSGAVGEGRLYVKPGAPLKDLELIGEKFFARLGVNKEADPLKAARALPPAKLLEAQAGLAQELKNEIVGFWDIAIDRQFLTDFPENIFRAGKQNPVPVITSATLGELTGPGVSVVPALVPIYVNYLNGVNKAGQKGYACIFDQVPSKWREEGCVSFHAMDTWYVFGFNFDKFAKTFQSESIFERSAGAKSLDPGFTDVDRKVSENMMAMWVQFARTGDPNVKGLVAWPAYDSAADRYLYIADPLQVKPGFSKIAQEKVKPAQIVRKEIKLKPEILAKYAGVYQIFPKFNLMITLEEGQLMAQATGLEKAPIFASSETQFFFKGTENQIDFVKDDKGAAVSLILHWNGSDINAKRISDKVEER